MILIILILRRLLPVRPTKRRKRPYIVVRSTRRVELGEGIQAFLLCPRTLQARLQERRLVCGIYLSIFSLLTRTIPADYRAYAPSPPFEEAGPTSCIWRAYLDESLVYDTDMLGNQRGQVNILLVFAGLFSAIVSAFIAQSAENLQPNYKELSALLLFDQINIQRALANGTSLDLIATSGADPTAPFTPQTLDSWINGLWFASLAFSLATALFAVLADEWYCHYLSPIAGDPQVRSRTRHLRYKGLLDWRVSTLIGLLPLMLYLSLGLFAIGLVLYL
ncbi:hypothetical protein EDD18DRAFT_1079171, partial [Armillaria luteobubalina]